jgi:hypothetical protein
MEYESSSWRIRKDDADAERRRLGDADSSGEGSEDGESVAGEQAGNTGFGYVVGVEKKESYCELGKAFGSNVGEENLFWKDETEFLRSVELRRDERRVVLIPGKEKNDS